jgi:hypothetical protein
MTIVNCISAREVNAGTESAHGISATPIGIGERGPTPRRFHCVSTTPAGISFPIERRGDGLPPPRPLTAAAQLWLIIKSGSIIRHQLARECTYGVGAKLGISTSQ